MHGFMLTRIGHAAAALCITLGLAACGGEDADQAAAPVRPAVLIEIANQAATQSITLPALIQAAETAALTFQVSGTLEALPVKAGDRIAKGDVIGQLNQREFINAAEQARSQFKIAESQFQRAEQLIDKSLISRSDYEQLESNLDVARAKLDSASKALEDTTLRSPFDGIVARVDVDQYQNVAPGTPIVTIQTRGIAEAVVQVPAKMVANSGRLQATEIVVELDAAPEQPVAATLHSTNTEADAATQTYAATFRFAPPEDLIILPGMTGTVRAYFAASDGNDSDNQITIPLGSVVTEGDQHFVWLVDTDTMTVSKRPIRLEPSIGEMLVVSQGLAPGDTIVGAGASYLFEGMTIRRYQD